MKRIWMYLSAYKKECVFAPLFKMLEALFELFVPLVVSAIIDTGIGNAWRAEKIESVKELMTNLIDEFDRFSLKKQLAKLKK